MEKVKFSANIPPQDNVILREIAERRGVSITNVLISAIKNQQFFDEETRAGSKIYLRSKNGEEREIIFLG